MPQCECQWDTHFDTGIAMVEKCPWCLENCTRENVLRRLADG